MTNNEKYTYLLQEISEILKTKNDTISIQQFQIATLESKIKELEGGKVCSRTIGRKGKQ